MSFLSLLNKDYSTQIVRGVEKKLLKGRREKNISGFLLVVTIIVDLVLLASTNRPDIIFNFFSYLSHGWDFVESVWQNGWQAATSEYKIDPVAIFFYFSIIVLLYLLYSILKRHFVKLSEEPFQYTFWIKPFQFTSEDIQKEGEEVLTNDKRIETVRELLHHDLKEKLNERIGRLSILNVDDLPEQANLSSHIQIEGYLTIREEMNNYWVLHIMPRIRIGPVDEPFKLTNPVKLPVSLSNGSISADLYNQAFEWVYSNVATEIYKQIKVNLDEKIRLFPNRYLKAVALYNEAQDFALSNTMDAYDLSIELYQKAFWYLDNTFRVISSKIIYLNKFFYYYLGRLALPWWIIDIRYHYMKSKIHNGYAQCKLYKSYLSSFTGRENEPLYELPENLSDTLQSLVLIHNSLAGWGRIDKRIKPTSFQKDILLSEPEKTERKIARWKKILYSIYVNYPTDTWLRNIILKPSQALVAKQKKILFETIVMLSLIYLKFGARYLSKQLIGWANVIAPSWSKYDYLYLLTMAEMSNSIREKLTYYAQSIKTNDRFEITQFLYARWRELGFRYDNEIYWERCQSVVEDYENTLKINPGNVAALASQGYLYWLTYKLDEAQEKFEKGRDIKTIVRKTFIGGINYGLARIALEKGQFNKCYNLYQEAVFSDPMVAAYSNYYESKQNLGIFYYDLMGSQMLQRYELFLENLHINLEYLKYCYHLTDVADLEAICLFFKENVLSNKNGNVYLNGLHHSNPQLKILIEQKTAGTAVNDFVLKQSIIDFLNEQVKGGTIFKVKKVNHKNIRDRIDDLVPGMIKFGKENNKDSDGNMFSSTVRNGVKSFVFNDFGNALINYYIRLGVPEYLDRTIEAYRDALVADDRNKVAHYNLSIAYLMKNKQTESYRHLKEARKLDRNWDSPVHNLARRSWDRLKAGASKQQYKKAADEHQEDKSKKPPTQDEPKKR